MTTAVNNEGVEFVTIKDILPLYRDNVEANNLCLIQFEENGFEVVAKKGLYNIGERAIYIKPDYNLKEGIDLTKSFIDSGYLGANNRIKAKSFNFFKEGSTNKIYSEGILIQKVLYTDYVEEKGLMVVDIANNLGVYKHQSDQIDQSESLSVKGKKGNWPEGLKKTDEANYKAIKKDLEYPLSCLITKKYDGSSISVGWIDGKPFVGSRNYERPIYIKQVVGRRSKTTWERFLSIFGKKIDLNIYAQEVNYGDDFVATAFPYLEKIYKVFGDNSILQGELIGAKSKGSGNKNNPDNEGDLQIVFFGYQIKSDCFGIWKKGPYNILEFGDEFPTVYIVNWTDFNTEEEFERFCNNYFKNNPIEGLVVEVYNNHKVKSFKYMNPEYDSKK